MRDGENHETQEGDVGERDLDALEAAEHREWQMDKLNERIARLERIEAAAREVVELWDEADCLENFNGVDGMNALRLALGSLREGG